MNAQKRAAMIQGIRDLADWLEAHSQAASFDVNAWVFDHGSNNEEIAEVVKAMGSVQKVYANEDIFINKDFSGVQLTYCVNRAKVCERIVIGSKTVPSQYIPEHNIDIVEWKCGPILESTEEVTK